RLLDVAGDETPGARHRRGGRGRGGPSRGQVPLGDQAPIVQQLPQTANPVLVVGGGQVLGRWHLFSREASLIDVPLAEEAGGQREREGAPLPLVVEHRLVGRDSTRESER